jgi:hydrogenase maturation protease
MSGTIIDLLPSPIACDDEDSFVPAERTTTHRTLVIGLGNPLVSDDSIGLRIVGQLKSRLKEREDVEVTEDYWGGLRLMERMVGYERAIVVDAICTGASPGTIHRLSVDAMPTQRTASAHDVNLPTALAFGRQAGAQLPRDEDIQIVAVEAEDVLTFNEECTPAVAAAIPRAVEEVIQLLRIAPGGPEE